MTTVLLPTHLQSYTSGVAELQVAGTTLSEVLAEVEARCPGLLIRIVDEQDRIRPHIKCFVAGEQVRELSAPIVGEVQIIAALSGG